jgi:hypothetical protein
MQSDRLADTQVMRHKHTTTEKKEPGHACHVRTKQAGKEEQRRTIGYREGEGEKEKRTPGGNKGI